MAADKESDGSDTKNFITHERSFYRLKELVELEEVKKYKFSVEDFLDFGASGKLPLCFVLAGRAIIYGGYDSDGEYVENSSEENFSRLEELSTEAIWKIVAHGKASIEYLYDNQYDSAKIDLSDGQPPPVVDLDKVIVRAKDWNLFKQHLQPEPKKAPKPFVENPKVIGILAYLYASHRAKSNSSYIKKNGYVNIDAVQGDIVDALADVHGTPYQGSMSFRVERTTADLWGCAGMATPTSGVAGVEGAVKGGQSPAERTLDGVRNASTLKGLGLVAAFRGRPPSPSGGEDFTALGGGARGGGARRARTGIGPVPHETTQTR